MSAMESVEAEDDFVSPDSTRVEDEDLKEHDMTLSDDEWIDDDENMEAWGIGDEAFENRF
jgi:hypothetical protein